MIGNEATEKWCVLFLSGIIIHSIFIGFGWETGRVYYDSSATLIGDLFDDDGGGGGDGIPRDKIFIFGGVLIAGAG